MEDTANASSDSSDQDTEDEEVLEEEEEEEDGNEKEGNEEGDGKAEPVSNDDMENIVIEVA